MAQGTTVIIPSKNEKFLNQTILDVLSKARGDIEIIVCLDSYYDVQRIPGIKYIELEFNPNVNKKRHGINEAVRQATKGHIMVLDAHCMVDEGFDTKLERDCEENWVMIPRRLRLDAENWKLEQDDRPPVDYEYPMWQDFKKNRLRSYRWESRTIERMDILIDDVMSFQGSCYFMHKDWFNKLGLMQIEGYGGFAQENEEIVCKTLANGGKVKVNKNTWFAHLHKGKKYGRMYSLDWDEVKESIAYSFDYYVNKNRETFIKEVEAFMPIPKWPNNWKDYLPKI